jgi:uncharacterized membrane protein YgdD (TMEM256/DUF423 family)
MSECERMGTRRIYFRVACALGGLAVVTGAFGAHGLEAHIEAERLDVWQTAVQYHFYHALALLALTWGTGNPWTKWASRACGAWVFGIAVFSGSLYLLALTGVSWLGAITPFGGVAFILGWAFAGGAITSARG